MWYSTTGLVPVDASLSGPIAHAVKRELLAGHAQSHLQHSCCAAGYVIKHCTMQPSPEHGLMTDWLLLQAAETCEHARLLALLVGFLERPGQLHCQDALNVVAAEHLDVVGLVRLCKPNIRADPHILCTSLRWCL